MTVLVGITGRAGVGKSLVAGHMSRLAGYEVVSFAAPIKAMAAALLVEGCGYLPGAVDWKMRHKEERIMSPDVTMRRLLQTLGTEWGRNTINPHMWVNIAADKISERLDCSSVVVDDVRFEDEAEMIRRFDGLIIHLWRPGWSDDAGHVSEAGIAVRPGDVVICNDAGVDDLMLVVSQAVGRFVSGADELLRLCLTPCADYRV